MILLKTDKMYWKIFLFLMVGLGMGFGVTTKAIAAHSNYTAVFDSVKQGLNLSDSIQTYGQDSLTLSTDKVEDWIKIRIKIAHLQNRMKANAGEYDNVVQSFHGEREELLLSLGWSVSEFDEVKERIHAAISAMDIADDLEESQENHEKEISEIRQNEFYTDSQKEQMIEGLKSMREQQREQYIEPTKDDWAAVHP
ncbi:MAG: hypothetical protein ACQEST_12085, partial [Bacteroidota bacterium]